MPGGGYVEGFNSGQRFLREKEESDLVALYMVCKTFNALPFAGGVMDQPVRSLEELMGCHAAFVEFQQEEMDKKIQEAEKERERLKRKGRRR